MKSMTVCVLILVILLAVQPPLFAAKTKMTKQDGLKAETFTGLEFRNIGPALMSGRISDVAIHPRQRGTWYVAVGSGGVWKTVNSGITWSPVFDAQPSYSIGCVAIDPVNPDIVWIGTGENVSGRHVGYGDGIYKSLNGGKTWHNMGLKQTEHISRILVNPNDNNIIYVASEGPLWSAGGERGVYKSTDGGKNWKPSLTISKDTGVVSLEFDPGNPDILYAAAYHRRRSVAAFLAGGPESGIYKTTTGGKEWRKLAVGLPKGHMGRIGLAVSPIKPNVVYATIEATGEEKGFYRSDDRGESWEKRNKYTSSGTGSHYYQEIFADPHVFDRVYQMDVWIHVTEDGGRTFRKLGEKHKHSDNHALAFDLHGHNPDYLLAGCDGGLYETWDRGKTWRFFANLPVTQFYKMALDNAQPFYNVHGGTQDNGSQMGPSRTLNINGIMNSDWFVTFGADGSATAIDPEDPNIIYVEWQEGHPLRYDKRSGEVVNIQPQPEPGEDIPRWNWDAPFIMSPHSRTRLYYGSQRVYRTDDRGDSWKAVSPDLTRNIFRHEQKIMGKTWGADAIWDHHAMSYYSTLSALNESPLKEGLIYAGSDDGLIHVTGDGGKNWQKIDKLPGVPDYFYVNDIKASLHDTDTVFAALDNHKTGDLKPYLLKSMDRGKTWTSIVGDLPHRHIVWAIAQDHKKKELLFIGTEFGIFFTLDGGSHWLKFKGGMPTISFRDIEIQRRENDLVGASFGRGFFILDDYSPLRHIDQKSLQQEALLFPVKKALMYIPRCPLDIEGKAFQGDSFYIAPNPPFGAIFTYYLKENLKNRKQARKEKEKKLTEQGKNIPFPSWDEIRKENREDTPAIVLTVKDRDGQVVRRLTGPLTAGIHRVAWDLRYPSPAPTRLKVPKYQDPWERPPSGPLVVPGTFSVSIARRIDGELTPLGDPQTFNVESLGLASLPAKDKNELLAFQRKAGDLQRAMMGTEKMIDEVLREIKFIKKALIDTPDADPRLRKKAIAMEIQLQDFKDTLSGDFARQSYHEPASPSLVQRLHTQARSTSPITGTEKRNYEIAAAEFETLLGKLRQLVDKDLKELEADLEAAGAPWTPGRGVPKWKKK
jgi:photosystem II stability/assembly factor-like uncharacterized protein